MPLKEYGFVMDLVGNLGALGIVFWLVQRTFSVTMPKLSQDFTRAIKESREDFKEALTTQSADFHSSLRYQQEYFANQVSQERKQTEKVLKVFETVIASRECTKSKSALNNKVQ